MPSQNAPFFECLQPHHATVFASAYPTFAGPNRCLCANRHRTAASSTRRTRTPKGARPAFLNKWRSLGNNWFTHGGVSISSPVSHCNCFQCRRHPAPLRLEFRLQAVGSSFSLLTSHFCFSSLTSRATMLPIPYHQWGVDLDATRSSQMARPASGRRIEWLFPLDFSTHPHRDPVVSLEKPTKPLPASRRASTGRQFSAMRKANAERGKVGRAKALVRSERYSVGLTDSSPPIRREAGRTGGGGFHAFLQHRFRWPGATGAAGARGVVDFCVVRFFRTVVATSSPTSVAAPSPNSANRRCAILVHAF